MTRGCASTTRHSSASHWLSRTTQLTWFFGGGPLVSQRSGFDVGNRTYAVDPDGLYGSSSALTGRCRSSSLAVIAAVIRLQAISARSWYSSKAGYVPPLQTRQVSSHCLVIRFIWPKR